jgi:glutamate-5-semialdehyde dehydrogenase
MSTTTALPTLDDKLVAARSASRILATVPTEKKDAALRAIADNLVRSSTAVIRANGLDLAAARENGVSEGLQDRLRLDETRLAGLAQAVIDITGLVDPVGETVRGRTLPNGLKISQVRVPFGVVGAIYEARPNVTIDIAALALKSGNAVVLRGGSAAENSNRVLVDVIQDALESVGLPRESVQTIDEFGRDGAKALMRARGFVDVLIPRGSAALINTVVAESTVPVIETGAGVVHAFIDESADPSLAEDIVHNAKTQRTSVCNTLETLLVHRAAVDRILVPVLERLREAGVVLHADPATRAVFADSVDATEEDWHAEYGSLDLAVKIVDSLDEAIEHIETYSTHHTETIITGDYAAAEEFLARVDSAVVMVNASTRFTDGGEFGFGAEVGISTQKLHARGPMGLPELTSTKWLVRGSGQIRG